VIEKYLKTLIVVELVVGWGWRQYLCSPKVPFLVITAPEIQIQEERCGTINSCFLLASWVQN
jgi:hypothetical protein